jgi:hypothetical protein
MVAGLDDFGLDATIEPHETITTLFVKFEKELVYLNMPYKLTAGYSIEHTRPGGFSDDSDDGDADYIGMQNGDPHVVAKYLTPAARLDPSKTVANYFGAGVTPETISIALTWPAEFTAHAKRERELGRIEFEELVAAAREGNQLPSMWPPAKTEASTRIAPNDHQITSPTMPRSTMACLCLWQWLASCLPPAARNCLKQDGSKKND